MQLRPRDGTGRAITANDGKLRSFTKIMDIDESDDLTYEGVKGGKIYKMLSATGSGAPAGYVKFAEYKHDNDVNKKVPKLKNIYSIGLGLVGNSISGTKSAGNLVVNFKQINDIRKYYVERGLISESDFNKILKDKDLIVKASPDENTTDYNDVKNFVDDAISTYRKMHTNRRISLKDPKYKGYIAKVLLRMKQNYVRDDAAIDIITYIGNDATEKKDLIYSGAVVTAFKTNGRSSKGAAEDRTAGVVDKATLLKFEKELPVIEKTVAENTTTELKVLEQAEKDYQPGWFRPISVQAKGEDAVALRDLIEETYDQFIKRTNKLIKKDKTIEYEFKDGGRKHRSGGVRKAHHSRHRDGAKSHKKRVAGRSRR